MRRFLKVALVVGATQAGAALLFRRQRNASAGERRHVLVVQGGSRVRLEGDELDDTVVSVLMGGLDLEADGRMPTRPPARLEVLVIMGGVDLHVPAHWSVHVRPRGRTEPRA